MSLAPGIPIVHHSRFLGLPNVVQRLSWKIKSNWLFLVFSSRCNWDISKILRINFTTFSTEVIGRDRNGGVLPKVGQVRRILDLENELDIVLILLVISLALRLLGRFIKLVSVPDPPLVKEFVLFHKIFISWIES